MTGLRAAGAVLALTAISGPAQAHQVISGVSGFPGGVVHPMLVASHAMSLLALGLLIGQQRKTHRRLLVVAFAAALFAGMALIALAFATEQANTYVLGCGLIAGIAAAIGRPLPLAATAAVAIAAGIAIAFDSVPPLISKTDTLLALAGTALGAWLMVSVLVILFRDPKRQWLRIGARVAGSWAAAFAMLVLALRLLR